MVWQSPGKILFRVERQFENFQPIETTAYITFQSDTLPEFRSCWRGKTNKMTMNHSNILWAGLGAGCVVVITLLYAFSGTSPTNVVSTEHPSRDATIVKTEHLDGDTAQYVTHREFQQFSEEMIRQFAALHSQLSQEGVEDAPVLTDEEDGLEDELAALSPEEIEEQIEAAVTAEIEVLDSALAGQAVDLQWAATAQKALDEAWEEAEVGDTAQMNAECRTTLCRIEVNLDESSSSSQNVDRLLTVLSFALPGEGFFRINPNIDGSPTAVMYIAREEHTLP